MSWYRAALTCYEPRTLLHYFSCKACGEVATVSQVEGEAGSEPQYLKDLSIEDAVWSTKRAAE